MERDLTWEDVTLWVLAALVMTAMAVTITVADRKGQLEEICGNNKERAEAGILVDTSNKLFAIKCHDTY